MDEAHALAESGTPENPYRTQRTHLGYALRESARGLVLLTATPHDGYVHSFRSLIELIEPSRAVLSGERSTIAEAYDITPDDFEHILRSFPVFAPKRKEFFAYLLQRLAEWKAEAASVARPRREYAVPDEPVPEAAEAPARWGGRSDSEA